MPTEEGRSGQGATSGPKFLRMLLGDDVKDEALLCEARTG